MIPDTLVLIDDSVGGKIWKPGQRKPNERMATAALNGETLAQVNGWGDAQVSQQYPGSDAAWNRLRSMAMALFDLELPPEMTREDFVKFYTTPLSVKK